MCCTSFSNVKAAGPWPVAADDMAMEAQDMTEVVVLVCSFKKRQTTREIKTTKKTFFFREIHEENR